MIKIYCIKSTNCDEVYVSFTRGDISDIFNSYKNKYNSYKNGHGAFRKIFKIFECDDCYYIILELSRRDDLESLCYTLMYFFFFW